MVGVGGPRSTTLFVVDGSTNKFGVIFDNGGVVDSLSTFVLSSHGSLFTSGPFTLIINI